MAGIVEVASSNSSTKSVQTTSSSGLTSAEAQSRLQKDGPNAMPDVSAHPIRNALAKFWAPVPWLLEASIVLEVVLHKYFEASIIAGLLVFNAALAYFQEGRAQATLKALNSRLALNASVERDDVWKTVPAAELVRGDLVKLSLGGVVPADVHLIGGSILLDQSMLPGNLCPLRLVRALIPMPEHWSDAVKQPQKLQAPAFIPSLVVPQNSCARRTLQVRSRTLYCASCVIWLFSTASSSLLSERMPTFTRCRGARLSLCCSRRFLLQYPWHCRQHSRSRRRL